MTTLCPPAVEDVASDEEYEMIDGTNETKPEKTIASPPVETIETKEESSEAEPVGTEETKENENSDVEEEKEDPNQSDRRRWSIETVIFGILHALSMIHFFPALSPEAKLVSFLVFVGILSYYIQKWLLPKPHEAKMDAVAETSADLETPTVQERATEEVTSTAPSAVPEAAPLRTVSLSKGNDGMFGFDVITTSASAGPLFVVRVTREGPAETQGLLEGDQIISVNGISVDGLSGETVALLFSKVIDAATVVVRHEPEALRKLKETDTNQEIAAEVTNGAELRTVTFTRPADGGYLGFLFLWTSVAEVVKGSQAERAGIVRGDEIVSIDGLKVTECNFYDIHKNSRANATTTFVVRHNPKLLENRESFRRMMISMFVGFVLALVAGYAMSR